MTVELFTSIGLSESKAAETVRNPTVSEALLNIIELAKACRKESLKGTVGSLLYQTATRVKSQCANHIPLLVRHICNENIKNDQQFNAAVDFLLARSVSGFTESEFCEACGVGVEITQDDVDAAVAATVGAHREELIEQRYRFNLGRLMAEVRQSLLWADGKMVKTSVDKEILALLGPKVESDNVKIKNKQQKPSSDTNAAKESGPILENGLSSDDGAANICELMQKKTHFHKPGENYKAEGYVVTPDTMDLLKRHLAQTGGNVVTRFPPEPNGILHIGHAKAININFGYAKAFGGHCYLRYDDTNPEKEEEKFFVAIRDMIEWLGYQPYRITHSSDYFDRLYSDAVRLIKSGNAYVCHQQAAELKGFNPPPSPYRDRPIEESLQLFEDMRRGKFDEGKAILRMKVTLEEGKQDPVAYRIKYVAHHRTGNKWCIYPTYDYTHCLCDSYENITHSLCTKEFQSRRSSYYWLCNTLGLYCPVQWEYGRLNVNYTVVSKRKIQKLITSKIVNDWDDPRLFTLTALRRRGIPSEAINQFVAKMGLTMALTAIDPALLDATVRDVLNTTAPRAMAVLDPIHVFITHGSYPVEVEIPDFPAEPERGSHKIAFSSDFYIDRDDFRDSTKPDKGFKRLTVDQPVGLKHVGLVITVKEVHRDQNGRVDKLNVTCTDLSGSNKPKGFIHWVSDAVSAEVRLYERLFKHRNPEDESEVPGGFLNDAACDTYNVIENALIDKSVIGAKVRDCFQFERVGYFAVDQDSTHKKLIFNRTVLLKEDSKKS